MLPAVSPCRYRGCTKFGNLLGGKKTGVVQHPEVFDHAGLLVNGPPGKPGCPSSSRPTTSVHVSLGFVCSLTQANHSTVIVLSPSIRSKGILCYFSHDNSQIERLLVN